MIGIGWYKKQSVIKGIQVYGRTRRGLILDSDKYQFDEIKKLLERKIWLEEFITLD